MRSWLVKCFLNLVFLIIGGLSVFSYALDANRLWLPQKYQTSYVGLLTAAQAAEAIDRCVEVIEGTLDLGQSTSEHPIFRILCKQSNGRSYNEMVDGLSYETLTTFKPVEVELTAEELARIQAEQEAAKQVQIKALKTSFWQACKLSAQEQTYLMQDLQWITTEEPDPLSFNELEKMTPDTDKERLTQSGEGLVNLEPNHELAATAVYCLEFDAKGPRGEALKYKALCDIDNGLSAKITIKKR